MFEVGERIRISEGYKNGSDAADHWRVGQEVAIIDVRPGEFFQYRVSLPDGNTGLLKDDEVESVTDGDLPEHHILPEGDLFVVSRHTVPKQVEYFGTDKDDRALYREVL